MTTYRPRSRRPRLRRPGVPANRRPAAVEEYETEEGLRSTVLGENHGSAFIRAEIVRGVGFGETADPDAVVETLAHLPTQLLDVVDDAAGSEPADVSEVPGELAADGVVDRASRAARRRT